MWVHFTFADGSNPFLSFTHEKLFEMIEAFYLEQTGEKHFHVLGRAQLLTAGKHLSAYQKKQAVLRDFAQEWQYNFANFCYSMSDLAEWSEFFQIYGKKYGLLREFRENGIL